MAVATYADVSASIHARLDALIGVAGLPAHPSIDLGTPATSSPSDP